MRVKFILRPLLLMTCLTLPAIAEDLVLGGPETSTGPRNVILIVGDGMDDQQITAARNYLKGLRGKLLLDELPLRSTSQILTVTDEVEPRPIYVADSANTASALATGTVTSIGRIATSPGTDLDLPTIAEQAAAAGFRTGVVATSSVTDATPASFAAHISMRLCQNPDLMEDITFRDISLGNCRADMKANGGPGSISEQLAASSLHVLLGGGSEHFEPRIEGGDISVLESARAAGFTTVATRDELLDAKGHGRLLGLFSPDTMPVRWRGEDGRESERAETSFLHMFHDYLGEATLPDPMRCEPNPEFEGMPSLKEMTDIALKRLSRKNDTGFFLMVESASIDKQSHERKPCGSIGELEQLEEALASALAFARKHPQTLILVTADHSQAAQIIPEESLFSSFPVPLYSPGKISRLITPEGEIMAINYATTNFMMEEHTGASVPLFANSRGKGRVPAFVQQPDIYHIMADYLGLR